jgi:predicted nucleic acid-binding Zn ribbon protein
VFNRWDELVGPELARRCEPVRLAGGVLVVRAENQAWAAQVRYLTGTLKRRAHEVLDQPVERVEVEIGPLRGTAGSTDEGA